MRPRRHPFASRALRATLAAGGVIAVALALAAAGETQAQRRAAPPPVAVAPTDPARAALDAALAPGLADTTRLRLEAFLGTHPRHPLAREARHELGLLAYARGDYAAARDEFRRARPSSGGDEARYWEALSAFALGRTREARTLALPMARASGKQAGPRRWDAAYLVALCWAQEGRKAEALAAYRELFALPPAGSEAAALYQGVGLARELGRTEDATAWRTRLLARAPRSPEAASLLADEPPAGPARPDSAAARRR
jgi:tetratricopeptide (TPR) repeat protein